jgi:beta-N-acetylhexosaminidase
MVDIAATALTAEDRQILGHPLVGGVILFRRNFVDVDQLRQLITSIHALREPPLLIAVDHEGGRVQRFIDGFTRLPAAGKIGRLYRHNAAEARQLAHAAGWVMASELRGVGVDFSFAPVLDLDRGLCDVVGDRAFHRDPDIVANLAAAYIGGMRAAGMAATGKHFPGHGGVAVDSHHAIPVDERPLIDLELADLLPFRRLIEDGLAAIMPAHVIYPRVDSQPAGFSERWLKGILRQKLGFNGLIFSDDLGMAGAGGVGDYPSRVATALAAGCDVALLCNQRDGVKAVLQKLRVSDNAVLHARLARMHGHHTRRTLERLHYDVTWQQATAHLATLGAEGNRHEAALILNPELQPMDGDSPNDHQPSLPSTSPRDP